jgi:hypothetical protein
VWTRTAWATFGSWKAVDPDALADVAASFGALLGYIPPMKRVPEGSGYMAGLLEREAAKGPRTAVLGGVDLVSFFESGDRGQPLVPGVDHDVRGSPAFAVLVASERLLPPRFVGLHPRPYEFWFSSAAHAEAFAASPLGTYLPGVGGHCTHGLAAAVDGIDVTASDLVDGRLAFVCVNTTSWGRTVNGTLFMNSCGMYADFAKDPAGDAAKASALWRGWFGDYPGPVNDACVQDGASWGGDYEAGLLPPACNIF